MRLRRAFEVLGWGVALAFSVAGCGGSPSAGGKRGSRKFKRVRDIRCGWRSDDGRLHYQVAHQARRRHRRREPHVRPRLRDLQAEARAAASTTCSPRASSTRTARPARTLDSALQKHGRRLGAQPVPDEPRRQDAVHGAAAGARRRPDDAVRRRRSPTPRPVENGLPDDYYVFSTTGGTGLPSGARRHAPAERDQRCRRGRSSSRRASPTTTTPRARCTASTRCGSSSTAASTTRRREPLGLPRGPLPVGRDHRRRRRQRRRRSPARLQRRRRRAKARRRWASTTCCRATRRTSSRSPTRTR